MRLYIYFPEFLQWGYEVDKTYLKEAEKTVLHASLWDLDYPYK